MAPKELYDAVSGYDFHRTLNDKGGVTNIDRENRVEFLHLGCVHVVIDSFGEISSEIAVIRSPVALRQSHYEKSQGVILTL